MQIVDVQLRSDGAWFVIRVFYQVTEEEINTKVVENFANKIFSFDYQETPFYYESTNGPKSVHLVTSKLIAHHNACFGICQA